MGCVGSKPAPESGSDAVESFHLLDITREITEDESAQLSLEYGSQLTLPNMTFRISLSDVKITSADQNLPASVELLGFSSALATPWSAAGHWPGIIGKASLSLSAGESLQTRTAILRILTLKRRVTEEIGRISLSMEELASGPCLHDMTTTAASGGNVRVTFTLKMTQNCRLIFPILSLKFLPREAEADLTIPPEEIEASVQEFMGVGTAATATGEVAISVSLGSHSTQVRVLTTSAGSSTALQVEASAARLRTESLRFQVSQGLNPESVTIGEVWLPLARLYETGAELSGIASDRFASRGSFGPDGVASVDTLHLKEKVWHEGRWVGSLEIVAGQIQGFPRYVQMSVGVVTGAKVVSRTSLFFSQISGGPAPGSPKIGAVEGRLPAQLTRLCRLIEKLKSPDADKYQAGNELGEVLAQMSLKRVQREGNGFEYASEEALTEGRRLMAKLAEQLFDHVSEGKLTWSQMQLYGRLLEGVLGRPEIEGLLVLPDSAAVAPEEQAARMDVRIRYRKLVKRMLSWSLDMFEKKRAYEIYEAHKELVPSILVRAFFMFRLFREELLRAVVSKEEADEEIEEWRGSGFALWPSKTLFKDSVNASRSIKLLFDLDNWNKALDEFESSPEVVIESERWKQRLAKKETTFFFFVKSWLRIVSEIAGETAQLFWHHIPGYRVLLKGVLIALKRRKVNEIPDALVNAASGFLANPKTLSVLVKLVLHRTNEYEQQAVTACVKVIDYFLLNLKVRKLQIPVDFDYSVFFDACNRLLYSDGAKNVYNLIWLIYRHFSLFVSAESAEFARQGLVDLFMKQRTFQLLLAHWAWFVRDRFILLLLFRFALLAAVDSDVDTSEFVRFRHSLARVLAKNLESPFQVGVMAFSPTSKALPVFVSPQDFSPAHRQYLAAAQGTWRDLLPKFRSFMALESSEERKRNLPTFALAEVVDLDLNGDSDRAVARKSEAQSRDEDEQSEDLE